MVQDAALLGALFAAGLVGGVGHCAGMCGPFVLAQAEARLAAVPAARLGEFHRVAGAALLPYHLGRLTTYAGLGGAAALLAGQATELTGLRWLSAALLLAAALFFLGYGVQRLWPALRRPRRGGEGPWARRLGAFARPLFARPLGWRGYALGVALGFLPCGLLYGAVAVAAASGHALTGALGMAAFALGTVPGLVAVGWLGHVAGRRWHGAAARIAPALMLANAGLLGFMAWRWIA